MRASEVAQRLHGKKSSSGWMAKCPAHEDAKASLAIGEGNAGNVLLKCLAGCEFRDIVNSAGLEISEMFADGKKPKSGQRGKIVSAYDYRDESGKLLFQAVRYEPKDFKQRAPVDGGWSWKTKGIRKVLYRLPELRKLKPGTVVFVVEGEKDANRIWELGLVATTKPGGADSKWPPDALGQLEGFRVVVIPDNDKPGLEAGFRALSSLSELEHFPVLLRLPDLPPKGDVSDWLDAGGTKAELMRLARLAMVDRTSIPEDTSPPAEIDSIVTGGGVVMDDFASVDSQTGDFFESRDKYASKIIETGISYIDDCALGFHPTDLIIISASTGAGKTTLGLSVAANAAKTGKKSYYFALEAFRNEIAGRLLFRKVSELAFKNGKWNPGIQFNRWMNNLCPEIRGFEKEAKRIVDLENKKMNILYRSRDFTHADIEHHFSKIPSDAGLIVIDHLHFVDIEDESENRGMKKIIKVIRDCSLNLGIPVVCIAHLRKASTPRAFRALPEIGDIHGSSDIAKIATKIIMLSPCPAIEFGKGGNVATTAIQILKDRYAGGTNYVGLCGFDMSRMEYKKKYFIAKLQGNGHTLSHVYNDELPYFAKKNGTGLRGHSGYGDETKLSE